MFDSYRIKKTHGNHKYVIKTWIFNSKQHTSI